MNLILQLIVTIIFFGQNPDFQSIENFSCMYKKGIIRDSEKEMIEVLKKCSIEELLEIQKIIEVGKINGSTYTGENACLIGSIANIRKVDYRKMEGIYPDHLSPMEEFFKQIRPKDTPKNNIFSAIALLWIKKHIRSTRAELERAD